MIASPCYLINSIISLILILALVWLVQTILQFENSVYYVMKFIVIVLPFIFVAMNHDCIGYDDNGVPVLG